MNNILSSLFPSVMWASCLLVLATFLTLMLLRLLPSTGHRTRTIAWYTVLVLGWLWFVVPIEIAWHPADPVQPESAPPWIRGVSSDTPVILAQPIESSTFSSASFNSQAGNIPLILAAGWLTGISICLLLYGWRYFVMARCIAKLASRNSTADPKWIQEFRQVIRSQGIRQRCQLLLSDNSGPFVCRMPRQYVVVVPETLWRQLEPFERVAIIRHELAHVQCGDLWKAVVARCLLIPQWFNPCSWLAVSKIEESIEFGCDERTAGDTPEQRIRYSRTLVTLMEHSRRRSAVSLAANSKSVLIRVERILERRGTEMKMTRMLLCALLVMVATFGVIRVTLVAQDSVAPAPDKTEHRFVNETANTDKNRSTRSVNQVTITYFTADLVVPNPEYGIHEFDGNQWKRVNEASSSSIDYDGLINLIQETIDPDSWQRNGGIAVMAPYRKTLSLIITQSPENHSRVQNLFTRLRELNDVMILVEAGLVVISPADLENSGIRIEESRTVISAREARNLKACARGFESSACHDLPSTNMFNGQVLQYQVRERDGKREYGGVDFSRLGFRMIVRADRKGLIINGTHETVDETGSGNSNQELAWQHHLDDEQFLAIDVSHLRDGEANHRAFLIVQPTIRNFR